jgi:hypothetical protein
MRARRQAKILFLRLSQHPDRARIGKCLRCSRYFFGRPGQKCCPHPRRCGSARAAIEATKRRWKRDRDKRIERARKACSEWERRRPRSDWKTWVAARIGLTPKWLTRAVNKRELNPPERRGQKRLLFLSMEFVKRPKAQPLEPNLHAQDESGVSRSL